MMSEGYTNRYKMMNAGHKEHIRQIHQSERMDMIARNKKLQQETNRRRKALASKRKLETQREEKRRQEILAKRREQQRCATEKYQRLNKTYTHVSPCPVSPVSTTPLLEDVLRVVQGTTVSTRQGSAANARASSQASTTGSTTPRSRVRFGSAKNTEVTSINKPGSNVYRNINTTNGPSSGTHNFNYYGNGSYNDINAGTNHGLNERTAEHAREVAARTALHSWSMRNLSNSRNCFEAQLEQHQSNIIEHQREALNQFNNAIHNEIEKDITLHGMGDVEVVATRSESLDSLDSLEDTNDNQASPVSKPLGPLTPRTNLLSTKADSDPRFLERKDLHQPTSGLQASHSESSLAGYKSDRLLVHPRTNAVQYDESPKYTNTTTTFGNNKIVTNIPGNSGFVLHGSLSAGANVAVVQPLSGTNSQNPSSNYRAPTSQPQYTQQVSPYTPPVGSANTNIHSYPKGFTNGHEFQLNEGGAKVPAGIGTVGGVNQSCVHGKDGALIGPLSGTQTGHIGQYYTDQMVNYVTQPNNNQFFTSNYNGVDNYKGTVQSTTNGSTKQQITNDEFHARTKAWASPSPNMMVPKLVSTTSNQEVPHVLTTNANPYSSRLTATNTTLTMSSQVLLDAAKGGSLLRDIPKHPPTVNEHDKATSMAAHSGGPQASKIPIQIIKVPTETSKGVAMGTVYNKGSIPSTLIVNSNSPSLQTVTSKGASTVPIAENYVPSTLDEEMQDDLEETSSKDEEKNNDDEEVEVEKVIKSILKQTNVLSPKGHGRGGQSGNGYLGKFHAKGRGSVRQASPSNVARDSLEFARDKLTQHGTKSVRFAEKLVEEQEAPPLPDPEDLKEIDLDATPYGQEKVITRVKGKPPRPASARVSTMTPKVEVSVRESRSSSAGTLRRRPIVRQQPTRVTVHNQSILSGAFQGQTPPSTATTSVGGGENMVQYIAATPDTSTPQKAKNTPVYDDNGLRLDRTPTDDEINWLWDKVRTCLSRTSTASSQESSQCQTTTDQPGGRQTVTMSAKYIDGNLLAPQFRTATRIAQTANNSMAVGREPNINNNGAMYQGNTRKKVSADYINSYGRKVPSGLLSQRKGVAPSSLQSGGTNHTTYQPIYCAQGPDVGNTVNQTENVPESMVSFLMAEQLAQQFTSESTMNTSIDEMSLRKSYQNSGKAHIKAPSAISQEEQRLLQSLERLNERLKMTDTSIAGGVKVVGHPPQYGFREKIQ